MSHCDPAHPDVVLSGGGLVVSSASEVCPLSSVPGQSEMIGVQFPPNGEEVGCSRRTGRRFSARRCERPSGPSSSSSSTENASTGRSIRRSIVLPHQDGNLETWARQGVLLSQHRAHGACWISELSPGQRLGSVHRRRHSGRQQEVGARRVSPLGTPAQKKKGPGHQPEASRHQCRTPGSSRERSAPPHRVEVVLAYERSPNRGEASEHCVGVFPSQLLTKVTCSHRDCGNGRR